MLNDSYAWFDSPEGFSSREPGTWRPVCWVEVLALSSKSSLVVPSVVVQTVQPNGHSEFYSLGIDAAPDRVPDETLS